MDIQGLVRNTINTEIRELNETVQVQNYKLKHDGYCSDRNQAEAVIHNCKFTISTLVHVKEEIARRIGFSIFDVFGNFYIASLDRDDLVKELKRIIKEDKESKEKSHDEEVRQLPPQTFEIRFKGKTIAAITTLEEADKVNLDRYLVDFEFDN